MKKWTLGMLLLSVSLTSQAGIITSPVTGGEMTGISVTVEYSDASTETSLWSAFDANSGGASTASWSLSQSGDTFGQFTGQPLVALGEWSLTNNSALDIVNVSIDAGIAGYFFDILPAGNGNPDTAGSGPGRPFVAWTYGINNSFIPVPEVSAAYFDQESALVGDLWGGLNISWSTGGLATNESIHFVTDTDAVSVSEPSIIMLLLGMLVAMRYRFAMVRK